MRLTNRAAHILSFATTGGVCCLALCAAPHAQSASPNGPSNSAAATLMQQMPGTWNVQQRMWPGAGAEAIRLPPAIARRRLIEHSFLEEVMEPAQKSGQAPFTRTAYFNYNAVNQQFEYFSLDSRAPQMMIEKSNVAEGQSKPDRDGIRLYGGSFVAPQWGEAVNAAFMYRLTIGQVERDRQLVQLYLTPQSGASAKEFLAFEYVYTRQR